MNQMKHILFLIGLVETLASCEKDYQPIAEFEFDKKREYQSWEQSSDHIIFEKVYTYLVGDTIKLKNISSDANNFVWILPDGTRTTSRDLVYVIPYDFCADGDTTESYSKKKMLTKGIEFTLEAFSKSSKKTDNIIKQMPVSKII